MDDHNSGRIQYTKSRLPVRLETYVVFRKKDMAYAFERYSKSGSGKAYAKKRLIHDTHIF